MAKKRGVVRLFSSKRQKEAVTALLAGDPVDVVAKEMGVAAATVSDWYDKFRKAERAWRDSVRYSAAECALDGALLEVHRVRIEKPWATIEYLDNYWGLVAFTDGYFAARDHHAELDSGWDAFQAWLLAQGAGEGSEGWELGVLRLAEKEGRPPAQLFFELLERFDRERQG